MWPYLTFIAIFAIPALLLNRQEISRPYAVLAFLAIVLFVGLRHHVGMDWNNYLRLIFQVDTALDLERSLSVSEPGYSLLMLISTYTGIGIYFANFVTAIVFAAGLIMFARTCPSPKLALLAGIPFLTVVVAMSANRQALAAGILMIVLSKWRTSPVAWKVGLIALAATFHYSAAMMLIFVAWEAKVPTAARIVMGAVFFVVAFYVLNQLGRIEYAATTYLSDEEHAQSSGSYLQMLLTIVPALALPLLWRKRDLLFGPTIIRRMAIFALAIAPVGYFFPVVTARILIYFFPMTMYAISALPNIFAERSRPIASIVITFTLIGQMVAWLTYSANSLPHFPYRNFLLIDEIELETGVDF